MQELRTAPAETSAQAPCWQGGSPLSSPQLPIMRRSTLVTPRGVRNSSSALVVFGLPFWCNSPAADSAPQGQPSCRRGGSGPAG